MCYHSGRLNCLVLYWYLVVVMFQVDYYKGTHLHINKKREDTLIKTPKIILDADKEPLVMVTTYQPEFNTMKEIIQKNWDLLNKSTATK